MVKLANVSYVFSAFLFFMMFIGIWQLYGDVKKYGWSYNQTTIVGDEVKTELINNGSMILPSIFLGLMATTFSLNAIAMNASISLLLDKKLSDVDYKFPRGKPSYHEVSIGLDGYVGVVLNDSEIRFPFVMVHNYLEQAIDKKKHFLMYVGEGTRPKWNGFLPFYVFRCPTHGVVMDYPHHFEPDHYVSCPYCDYGAYFRDAVQ